MPECGTGHKNDENNTPAWWISANSRNYTGLCLLTLLTFSYVQEEEGEKRFKHQAVGL